MDIQAEIIYVGEPREGVSTRTSQPWKSQDFVIETHDTYPRKCCFSVFGEDKIQQFNIKLGDQLTVSFDIDAHEYQGRWYNSIRAWRVVRTTAEANSVPPVGTVSPAATDPLTSGPSVTGDNSEEDALPF